MKHFKALSLLLFIIILVSPACSSQETPLAQTTAPAAAQSPAESAYSSTEMPAESASEGKNLTVLAAASLTEPFTEIGTMFQIQNPGAKVTFSFAGSQQLAQQLDHEAPADVFASASKKYMDAVVESGRVDKRAVQLFANNRLVVIFPKENPAGLKELIDLANPGLKLDFAAKEVPVGQYTLDFLDKAGQEPAFGTTFRDDVLKNVVSYEENVKSVVTKIILAEADAGIVYLSDISQDAVEKVQWLDIPDAVNVIASYPIAPIMDSQNPVLAQAFVDLVLSTEGQQILEKYNFMPVEMSTAASLEPKVIVVTDALGRSVEFMSFPQRIALAGKANLLVADALYLFPEAAERVFVLGKGTQGTGNFLAVIDPNYDSKPKLENEAGYEQIAAERPDAVILKSYLAETLGQPLEALGIPVVYLDFETPDQYFRDLATLGQLFEDEARAQLVTDFYRSRMEGITQKVSGINEEEKPKTLLLYYSDKDGEIAFSVPPMSWMQTILVETAGGAPVWEDANLGKGWTKVTLEQVAAWDVDKIFIISYSEPVDKVVEGLRADPQWQSLRAVKEGSLFAFAGDMLSWDQADSRWILGLAWLASKLHPELFSELDMQKEAQIFYMEMYGLSEETIKDEILPLFGGDLP